MSVSIYGLDIMFKYKPFLRVLFLFLLSFPFGNAARAFSFSATVGSGQVLYFDVLTDSTVAVTFPNQSAGSYYSGYQRPVGALSVPSAVLHGGVDYRVVSVGDNAFMGCTGLTSVELPSSVTMIGVGAFQGCSGLRYVSLGSSVSTIGNVAFEGCSAMTVLDIPNSVTLIGNWAFCNCTALDSVYIGSSVAYLSSSTFAGTDNVRYLHYNAANANVSYFSAGGYRSSLPVGSLTRLVVGDSVRALQQYAFSGAGSLASLYLGKNLSSVSSSAFDGCSNVRHLDYNASQFVDGSFPAEALETFSRLSHLVVGDAVSYVPAGAFSRRDSLRSVVLSETVDSLGDSCFWGCVGLTDLTMSDGLSAIGVSAFQGCRSLSGELELPNTLLSIGSNAFQGCAAIEGTLSLPSSLAAMGQGAFSGCANLLEVRFQESAAAVAPMAFSNCERLYRVVMGNYTAAVGADAFRNCTRLTEVVMGPSLSSIGSNAFHGDVRLANPLFANVLATIGDSAFYGCSSMGGHLVIPQSVVSVGDHAFAGIGEITALTVKAAVPPTICAHSFAAVTPLSVVYVPCGSLLNYHVADHWDDFSNLVEDAPFVLSVSANDSLRGSVALLQSPTCGNHAARIQAVAREGFHFLRWQDGNTANPRQLLLSSDTSFVAVFVSDYSYISVSVNDTAAGTVTGAGLYGYNDSVVITAIPNAGYHFQCWNDGSTANPRRLAATQDTAFTAIFFSNISTIAVSNNNPSMGSVSGGGIYYYQHQAVITATPFYGYHFTSWNDGVTANPRTVAVSQDSSFAANFAVNIYDVVAVANNGNMGAVQGGGSYGYLSTATLTATAAWGYHFERWSDGVTDNPRVCAVVSDSVFTALFAPNSYQISVSCNDSSMGMVYGGGAYGYNSTASISAVPSYGYHFVRWGDGDLSNPRSVTVVGHASYTAFFAVNSYNVSVASADSSMGTVSGGGSYVYGSTAYIAATAAYGYHFVQWNDGNTDNPRQVGVSQDAGYVAQFAANSYSVSVTANNSALGVVSGGGSFLFNATTVLTATPYHGFYFVRWSDGNTDNPRTLTVSGSMDLVAQFDSIQYTLATASNNYAAGNVIGGGSYAYLSHATVTAVPMPHYHFVRWSDSSTVNPRVVTITGDTLLTAYFAIDTHCLSVVSGDTSRGSVSGSGVLSYGTATYIAAQSKYGYHFSQWDDGNVQNPRRVVVASDTAFTALFEPNRYAVVLQSSDTALGMVSGAGSYDYLSEVILTATPVGNSRFGGWSDGVSDNPRTIVLSGDTSLVATFISNECSILCQANDSSLGTVSGAGIYDYLSQAVLAAVPDSNCHFVAWSDGVVSNPRLVTVLHDSSFTAVFQRDERYFLAVGCNDDSLGSTEGQGYYYYGTRATLTAYPAERAYFVQWSDGVSDNPRSVQVLSDCEYTAIFACDSFSVALSSNYPHMGALYGGGVYAYGQEAVITAVAFPGVKFLGWSDSVSDNPRRVVVVGDTVFHAIFRDMVGIDGVDKSSYTVSVEGRTISVEGAAGRSVAVYDLYGRQIAGVVKAEGRVLFTVATAGVYLVRIDGDAAKKVVVP